MVIRRCGLFLSSWLLAPCAFAAAGDEFHPFRLNGPLPRDVLGDVFDAKLSPNGQWIVYSAVQSLADGLEVYSVPADGSQAPIRLSNHSTSVSSFRITPDGARVVYLSTNLYSVPIGGGQVPVKLNGTLPGGGAITSYVLAPDSSRVVYRGDAHADNAFELFSAPIGASGGQVTLNDPLLGGAILDDGYAITPDSSRVVYLAPQSSARELYRVPIDRSLPPSKLNPSFPSGGNAVSFVLSATGDDVFYTAGQDVATVVELYRVPTNGGASIKINAPLPPSNSVAEVRVSPDVAWVAYRLSADANGRSRLYGTSSAGGQPASLLGHRLAGSGKFQFTSDSSRVVYLADQDFPTVDELFSVPIGGGAPTQINGTLVNEGDVQGFLLSPDGQRVVYRADELTDGVSELFSVPTAGGTRIRLDEPFAFFVGVQNDLVLTPDGAQVLFRADPQVSGGFELFGVPLDGSLPPLQLTHASGPLRSVQAGFVTGTQQVVFRGDLAVNEAFELYRVPLDGSQGPVRVNPPLPRGNVTGDVDSFVVPPRGARVVYGADQRRDSILETFSVLRDGGASVQLNDPLAFGFVQPIHVTPDGERVILYSGFDLFSAPTDGSRAAVRLTGPSSQANQVENGALLGADGARVVYVSQARVHSVPSDGSLPPVVLDSPDIQGNGVEVGAERIKLSPDGTRVVFLADRQLTTGLDELELFSAPLDGSQPAQRLHGVLPNNVVVIHFDVSPDSSRVVFCANLESLFEFDLYSVPIDGGEPPRKISGPRSAGGLVEVSTSRQHFQITPDGASVVFLSHDLGRRAYELYAAPIDASQGPIRLSGSLVPGGDVLTHEPALDEAHRLVIGSWFQVAHDGRHVVYIADARVDQTFELFSVALPQWRQRTRLVKVPAPVRLNLVLASGARFVGGFEITPDSENVVYLCTADQSTRRELFRVPIKGGTSTKISGDQAGGSLPLPLVDRTGAFVLNADGTAVLFRSVLGTRTNLFHVPLDLSRSPRMVNPPLVALGEVRPDFCFSPDGEWVFYRADQDTDEVVELFGATARKVRPASPPGD